MTEEVRQKKIKVEIHNDNYTIYNGSMLDMLEVIQPNSIDSIVCDPPYELNFMNKGWDNCGISFNPDTWKKCYEVLKPGGYLLAFGGSRTFHRIACAIEDAGFEIRDTIMWLYGSGFPKSMNIGLAIDKKNGVESKVVSSGKSGKSSRAFQSEETTTAGEYEIKQAQNEWQGWGTALKPAYEPIIVARKPLSGTVVDNVLTYGVGGINIDECRVPLENSETIATNVGFLDNLQSDGWGTKKCITEKTSQGRFPANVIHDGSEEVVKLFPYTNPSSSGGISSGRNFGQNYDDGSIKKLQRTGHDDNGGSASRFFYTAKASKKDRDEGLEFAGFEEQKTTDGNIRSNQETARIFGANSALRKNIHPTVKPVELMQYLVRLVSPKGATILDPFMGSGSTGKAVMFENRERNANYKFIGIDLEEKYCQIAIARIDYALNKFEYDYIKEKQEAEARGQANIFDFIEVN
jgi:DNA modification methylase